MDPEVPEIPQAAHGIRPPRRLRKGMYILPSLFTTANIAFGYYAILQVTHATVADAWHFDNAAKAIGFAVLFDGLDGRIARMTGHQQRFWPGTRFAGGCHHLRRGSRAAGLDVGISTAAARDLGELYTQAGAVRRDRQFPVSDGRRQPPGALQYHQQSAAFESRAVRARSISSACRFRRAQV